MLTKTDEPRTFDLGYLRGQLWRSMFWFRFPNDWGLAIKLHRRPGYELTYSQRTGSHGFVWGPLWWGICRPLVVRGL